MSTKRLPARANYKFGVGAGRRDAQFTHIVAKLIVEWSDGRPIRFDATWLCSSRSTSASLRPEATEALPLCPACEWADTSEGPFVYLAERDGRVKIGFSAVPGRRAHQLHAELLCHFPGDLAAERALHARFDADRIAGEWFRPSAALRAFIAELQERAA